jgi:hypothetical protein
VKVGGIWRYVYRAVDQYGQIIDVYVSARRDTRAARRFFTTAVRAYGEPAEVVTDRAPALRAVIDELMPGAFHNMEQYENNRVECDHGRLKARLRPMRGLKRDHTAHLIMRGHSCRTCVAVTTNSEPTCARIIVSRTLSPNSPGRSERTPTGIEVPRATVRLNATEPAEQTPTARHHGRTAISVRVTHEPRGRRSGMPNDPEFVRHWSLISNGGHVWRSGTPRPVLKSSHMHRSLDGVGA